MEVWEGNITTLEIDAIVNAASQTLLGGGGVDGAIHKAAGPGLLEECKKLGGCKPGDAKITGGHNLPVNFIIHTVGPVWRGGKSGEPALLESCYRKSLDLVDRNLIKHVAFSMISTGAYGYPLPYACDIAARAVSRFLMSNDLPLTVRFCTFDRLSTEAMRSALAALK